MSPMFEKERKREHSIVRQIFRRWVQIFVDGDTLSQTLTFSSRLPGIAVDVDSTSGSAPAVNSIRRGSRSPTLLIGIAVRR